MARKSDVHNDASEAQALHKDLRNSYAQIRHALFFYNWAEVEHTFWALCERYNAHIPAWFAEEYVFQAMRLWASDQLGECLRHFAGFINRAAGQDLIDAGAERDLVRQLLDMGSEKPS